MIITRRTLEDRKRALVGWGLGVVGMVLMYTAFYPSIRDNAAGLNDYMKSLPKALRELIGRSGEITSPTGYLGSEVFSVLGPLLMLILAIGAGSRAIAGEEEAATLDLLLATPITRRRVVLEKAAAMYASLVGIGVVMMLAIVAAGPPFGMRVGIGFVAAACVSTVLTATAFGSLALLVGCWRGKRGVANGVVASTAVAMYLINALAPAIKGLEPVRLLSLFYYYFANDPLRHGLSVVHVSVLLSVIAASLAGAVAVFDRRDLAA